MTPLSDEYRRRCAEEHDMQHQMPVLYAWARHARTVIELGVRSGNSTSAFLAAFEADAPHFVSPPDLTLTPNQVRELQDALNREIAASGGKAILLPPGLVPPGREWGLWSVDAAHPSVPDDWAALPFWHLLVADDRSPEALAFCPDGADVLFIDTSHTYPHTLEELRLYAPKVRPGGVILLHDTERPEVSRSLSEWCAESGLEWYDHPFWHGLGVVEIPGAWAQEEAAKCLT